MAPKKKQPTTKRNTAAAEEDNNQASDLLNHIDTFEAIYCRDEVTGLPIVAGGSQPRARRPGRPKTKRSARDDEAEPRADLTERAALTERADLTERAHGYSEETKPKKRILWRFFLLLLVLGGFYLANWVFENYYMT